MYGFYAYSSDAYAGLINSVATSYTFTGATTGSIGVPITYTLQANGVTSAIATPATTGSGTFSPTTEALNGTTPVTLTYTPSAAGTVTLSVTNNGGLTNPPPITLVVSSVLPPRIIASNRNIASSRNIASNRTIASLRIVSS